MLRPYQTEAIHKLKASLLKGNRRVILTLATGAGKSVIARAIVEMAKAKNNNVLFVAHRTILINQMRRTFTGLDNVTVGTVQALHKKLHNVKIVIIDEVHFGSGSKMQNLLPDTITIGLSATPLTREGYKLDGWDDVIDVVQLCDLIEMGYAADVRVMAPIAPDRRNIKIKQGDYDVAGSYEAMTKSEMVRDIISVYQRHAEGLRTLVYCVNIQHAETMKASFAAAGYRCDSVHSKKEDSAEAFDAFKRGDVDILCSVDALTTGVDLPDVYCILLAVPTKSIVKAVQIYGRATRLNPADPDKLALILDCAGVIDDTIHPKQRMTFNREKPKNKKDLCECGGSKKLLNKTVSEPDSDGFYMVTTTRKCDRCPNIFTDEKMHLIPVSECGCPPNNEMTMKEESDKIVWSLRCRTCGNESEYRSILYNEAELQEIAPPLPRDNWDAIKMELRKATRADGKKYHYKWADHSIFHLQLIGADPKMVIEEIDRYNANGWKLGGIQYAIEKKIKGNG